MADSRNPNGLPAVGQLIQNSVGTHPQRVEAAEPPAERMAGEWVPLEQAE